MGFGSIFYYVWETKNPAQFDMYGFPLAAGLLAGEGLGGVVQALLTVAGVGGDGVSVQENVLINDLVQAVLCDFGLARLADGQPSGLTTTKTIKGSIRYMSPELLDEDPVMTGLNPYNSHRSDQQVLLALALRQPPALIDDLELQNPELEALLAKCWDATPAARPQAPDCLSYLKKPVLNGARSPRTIASIKFEQAWETK
ncbi:hypothetical protein FRC01_010471 [Tulasnella sp. 417]|nr:hypothetical protein FRC01_010471 [Tulasnella sp. 417]